MTPIFDVMTIEGSNILLRLSPTVEGLTAKAGKLEGFTISADGKRFVAADAEIRDGKVVISNGEIAEPMYVRYAFIYDALDHLFQFEEIPEASYKNGVW